MFKKFFRQICSSSILGTDIKSRNEIRIVIIGAGLAGLTAASHLIANGFENTIVLEASDRLGGRIKSKYFGDVCCELGAKWITLNTVKYSIYELIRQEVGLQKNIKKNTKKIYYNIQGYQVDQKLSDVVDLLFKRICGCMEFQNMYKAGVFYDINNVHTYLQGEAHKIMNSMSQNNKHVANAMFSNLIKEFSSLMGCCSEYINIEHIPKMNTSTTNSLYIPTGMDNILSKITENFDLGHVKLGKPVEFIKWSDSIDSHQGVLCCADGSSFSPDHIICTLPLGVLKNFSKHIFNPDLPEQKLSAIKCLGFGCPIKVYIEYKDHKSWFPMNVRPLRYLPDHCKELSWTNQIIEISNIPSSRRVLEIIFGGGLFEEIEKLPDKEIVLKVTNILRKCLKNPSVPYPLGILRSSWSSSACFLGGQPYFSVQSSINDIIKLAAPLGKNLCLLFAGDATIINGFGSMDGAHRSGLREAERIIEYYNTSRYRNLFEH